MAPIDSDQRNSQNCRIARPDPALTIAFVRPDELDDGVAAEHGDAYLETLVRHALLR